MQNSENYSDLSLDEATGLFEKKIIMQALKKADGVKNQAAKILKINTSSLYYKMEKYDLLWKLSL